MLHLKTVEPGTFAVLKRLMSLHELDAFSLVGGTALSLRYGHRRSIDLDLFGQPFDQDLVHASLLKEFGDQFVFEPSQNRKFGLFCFIDNVKVDIVNYPHPRISDLIVEEGIRMYADADIAAMKIQAMLGRGRKKDFWDLHELLGVYSLEQISEWHSEKYPDQMLAIAICTALTYFSDADKDEPPVSLKGQTWKEVKDRIRDKVRSHLK